MPIASTPAVGPRPTTRTNSSAHTSSGTERSSTAVQRSAWRSAACGAPMREASALTDSRADAPIASGTAISQAIASPAVAMATVRQVSRASRPRNSASARGGTNCARKRPVDRRLRSSSSCQGLNSVSTNSGHSSTARPSSSVQRRSSAGSRPAAGAAA